MAAVVGNRTVRRLRPSINERTQIFGVLPPAQPRTAFAPYIHISQASEKGLTVLAQLLSAQHRVDGRLFTVGCVGPLRLCAVAIQLGRRRTPTHCSTRPSHILSYR